jgi:DNA-binding NarL/FixJ family response regulator
VNTVRILVVDDHALFRAGLVSLLGTFPEFEIVGEAGDGREALEFVKRKNPDVILLDVNMPVMNGVEMVEALQKEKKPRILMLTISKHDEDLFGAIAAGADGYLLKNAEPEELRRAINLVAQGNSILSPEVTSRVMKVVSRTRGIPPEVALSKREMDVLNCLSDGLTSAQIAEKLFISENTVKTHVRHILEKLEASNRAEAVSRAVQLGILHQ